MYFLKKYFASCRIYYCNNDIYNNVCLTLKLKEIGSSDNVSVKAQIMKLINAVCFNIYIIVVL